MFIFALHNLSGIKFNFAILFQKAFAIVTFLSVQVKSCSVDLSLFYACKTVFCELSLQFLMAVLWIVYLVAAIFCYYDLDSYTIPSASVDLGHEATTGIEIETTCDNSRTSFLRTIYQGVYKCACV